VGEIVLMENLDEMLTNKSVRLKWRESKNSPV
jgi:hypothetical protein